MVVGEMLVSCSLLKASLVVHRQLPQTDRSAQLDSCSPFHRALICFFLLDVGGGECILGETRFSVGGGFSGCTREVASSPVSSEDRLGKFGW